MMLRCDSTYRQKNHIESTADLRNRRGEAFERGKLKGLGKCDGIEMTTAEEIAYIRKAMGLSITDLAELIGVARSTISSWINGAESCTEHREHLARLALVSQEVEAAAVVDASRLLKRKLSGGCSLFELIKANQSVSHVLSELSALADFEAHQRSQYKGGKAFLSMQEISLAEGLPGFSAGS